jgi:hypothetical protein
MEKPDIIRALEEMAKFHYSEAEKYEKAAQIINQGELTIKKPLDGPTELIETDLEIHTYLQTFENINLKFWAKKEVEEYLIEFVGEERVQEFMSRITAYITKAVKSNQMIRMTYNNSKLYTFYSTHQDWVEHVDSEHLKYKVIEKHAPAEEQVSNLSQEQMNPARIVWAGVNPKN